jgi:hypothetical protein
MEIVKLPFIEYRDELAYMEHLDNPDTQAALRDEAKRWSKATANLPTKHWLNLLQEADETMLGKPHFIDNGIEVRYLDHDLKRLRYKKRVWSCVYEYTIFKDLLLIIEDIKWQGSERKKLTAYRFSDDLTIAWSVENVGSMITSKGKIIIQTSQEVQRFYTLEEITEKGERIPLVKSRSLNQVVRASRIVGTRLFYFQEGRRFRNIYAYDFTTKHSKKVLGKANLLGFSYPFWWTDIAVYNVKSTQQVWQIPDNRKIADIIPVGGIEDGFFCQTITHQIVQLSFIRDGKERILFEPNTGGKLLVLDSMKRSFLWFSPTRRAQHLDISASFEVKLAAAPDLGLEADYSLLTREGHHIPATTIFQKGKEPRALIAYVYGHYGIPTPCHLIPRFLPFIREGYAISLIGVRGGGDNGIAGWDAARGHNRLVGLLDYIAAIPQIQALFNVKPAKTILYGRSAGGFHVANAVQRVSKARALCGAVCAEVPFVDVVKGCTNDVIPVLRLEVDEFFNCEDYDGFRAAASLDPLLTTREGPGVPILTSGGLHDTEVMYWEPLKWTTLLRKKGWRVACRIDAETGHFMQGPYALEKRAEESAWLHSAIGLD